MSNILYLHKPPAQIARFLRVTEHRRLEQLSEAGKLPYHRFVFDAGSFAQQAELAQALRQVGSELVLDTNIAELSSIGKFDGHARHAPWARPDQVLVDFDLRSNDKIIAMMARFAI